MSKTINTTDELIQAFVNLPREVEYRGVELRAVARPNGAELRLEAHHQKFFWEIRPVLQPSRKVLQPLQTAAPKPFEEGSSSEEPPWVLVAPHIPDELASDYRRAGINHADLNGRFFLQLPFFLLDRSPTRSIHRNPTSELDIFSPKTSRIARALLAHRGQIWRQDELTERTLVSRGLVSRALGALVEQNYVAQESRGSRNAPATYRLIDFDRLLDTWKARDIWNKRVTIRQYSMLAADAGEIAETIRDALGPENTVFTQWFAAHLRHPYTTPPIVSAYVPRERPVPTIPFARSVPNGGNLWLVTPEDEGVLFETQEHHGFQLVSDVQIYLDLVQMGQRGPDAAEALRAWDGFAR